MMARAKGIYIFIIKVNKLFFFFSSRSFLKEIENMFCLFLSSYKNTRESLRELEKAVETLACGSCSYSISRSPQTSIRVSIKQLHYELERPTYLQTKTYLPLYAPLDIIHPLAFLVLNSIYSDVLPLNYQ